MSAQSAKFDGLAENYDKARPRYPAELFRYAVSLLGDSPDPVSVLDAGAGTGIALEGLMPLLPADSAVTAVDISSDMVRLGAEKFPSVDWHVGRAEELLPQRQGLDLVIAAQAYQWMDRAAYIEAAADALRSGGVCAVVQNNRNYAAGGFAEAYEDLLELRSPGYSRTYRAIDIPAELAVRFPRVERCEASWEQPMTVAEFVTMSSSSTQAQRAVAAVGEGFLDEVRDLCERWASAGTVALAYVSEGFYGVAP